MSIKQKIKQFVVGAALVLSLAAFSNIIASPNTDAACDPTAANCCGGVETAIISCAQTGTSGEVEDTGAWGVLLLAINILTAGVGVATLGGIVYASIMYTSSGGNPEQTKKAMQIITNIVIGVIAYAGMYALLNFLVPGGLFAN